MNIFAFFSLQIECKELPRRLQSLILHSCLIRPGWFAGIADTLPNLKLLNIGSSAKTTDSDLGHISKCSGLTSLDISGCYRVSQTGVESIATSLLNLKELNLESCGAVTDLALHHIARNLKQLEVLSLGRESPKDSAIKYTNSALINYIPLMASLCQLNLRNSACDDAVLRAFDKMRRNLVRLDVSFTKVSLSAVETFSEACTVIHEGIVDASLESTYSGETLEV